MGLFDYRLEMKDKNKEIERLNSHIDLLNSKNAELEEKVRSLEAESMKFKMGDNVKEELMRVFNIINMETFNMSKIITDDKELKDLKFKLSNMTARYNSLKKTINQSDNRFDIINDIYDSISKFLDNESKMFIDNVVLPLDKSRFYSVLIDERSDSGSYSEIAKYFNLLVTEFSDWYGKFKTSIDARESIYQYLAESQPIIEMLIILARGMKYETYVKRSVKLNNNVKMLLDNIIDKLAKINNDMDKELLELRVENKELRNKIHMISTDDNKDDIILKLQQEIAGLKVENEILRFNSIKEGSDK